MAIGYGYTQYVIGGASSGRKSFRYSSRPLYANVERTEVSELMSARLLITANDDRDLDLSLNSDDGRIICAFVYDDVEVVSTQSATKWNNIRKFVDLVPQAGCLSSFFSVILSKSIDTEFRFSGLDLYALPRPQYGSEFILGGTISGVV